MLDNYPQLAEVMVAHAMVCVGCPISGFHTIAEVAAIYELDENAFIRELQEFVDTHQNS